MSEALVLFGGDRPGEAVEWRRVAASGAIEAQGLDSPETIPAALRGRCILVLPGYVITTHEAVLTARNDRQALAAAPFAIEDELASDPDGLHLVLLPQDKSEPSDARSVLVAEKQVLEDWIGYLGDLDCRLHAVVPDYLCLPKDEEQLVTLGLAERLVLRDRNWGAAIDADMVPIVAEPIIERRERSGRLTHLAGDSFGLAGGVAASPQIDGYSLLAQNAVAAGPGLLQGSYAVRGKSAGPSMDLRRWMWPAAIAASALITLSGVNLVSGLMLRAETAAVQASTHALFLETFPDTQRVVNLRAQLREARTGDDGGRPEFLVLSAYLAAGLTDVDAVSIEAVRFDTERNELSVSVLFDTYEALADFNAAIERAGGRVEEGGSRQVGNRRAGDLRVRIS